MHMPHRLICRSEYPYIHKKKKKNYLRFRQVIMRNDYCFEKNKEQEKKICDILTLLMGANYKKAFRRYAHRSSRFLHSAVTRRKS